MLAFVQIEGRKLTILYESFMLNIHSQFNFAPFILIQFDLTNVHVDNYIAIAAIFKPAKNSSFFIVA